MMTIFPWRNVFYQFCWSRARGLSPDKLVDLSFRVLHMRDLSPSSKSISPIWLFHAGKLLRIWRSHFACSCIFKQHSRATRIDTGTRQRHTRAVQQIREVCVPVNWGLFTGYFICICLYVLTVSISQDIIVLFYALLEVLAGPYLNIMEMPCFVVRHVKTTSSRWW